MGWREGQRVRPPIEGGGAAGTGAGKARSERTPRMVHRPELGEYASQDRPARNGRMVRKESLENLLYARPYRSAEESRVTQQLIWQWWRSREPGKWGKKRVARLVRVDPSWVCELARRFATDPGKWKRRFMAYAPATMEHLQRAREETRRQRERGWVRPEARWHRVVYVLGGKREKAIVPSRAAQRRELEAEGRDLKGQRARAACGFADPRRMAREQLPLWARGVEFEPLPRRGDVLSAVWQPGEKESFATTERRGPVHFARRRRF